MPDNNDNNEAAQTAARYAQTQERDSALLELQHQKIVEKVFAEHELKFTVPPAQVLQGIGKVYFLDGKPFNAGKPLEDRLREYSQIYPQAVANTVAERHDRGASTVRSKADLKTVKDRSDFISNHSLAAFEALPRLAPQTETVSVDQLTAAQYRALPVRDRARIAEEKGPGWISRLLFSEGDQERMDRLTGKPRR